ncbi:MAG: MlaD family protein [Flavipsychrobacter sp.]|nr:MlaD family protein [Flavipsychrobacter sp.]
MQTTSAQKIRIGIFTLAGIGVLVAGIFLVGKKQNLFGDTTKIYGTFKNVGGLQIGNNVRFAGINVGTVEAITILNDTTVRVDMRLQKKVTPFLKTDAIASIGSDGLMGDKLVTIAPGAGTADLVEKGDRIATVNPVDFDKVVGKITGVVDNAEKITDALAGIVGEVKSGKGSIGKLLYSDTLAKSIQGTVNTAHQTMQSIKKSSEGFSQNMDALHHNVLLRGYFKRKAKKAQDKADKADQQNTDNADKNSKSK